MKRVSKIILIFAVLFAGSNVSAQKSHSIRLATVAPRGTPVDIANELNKELMELSGGRLKLTIYAGSRGDDSAIVKKLDPRRGNVDAGMLTGFGLGQIAPSVRILEVPYLFNSYEEVDYVVEKLHETFSKEFENNGFVLLGWAEVGFVYVFSKEKISTQRDLKRSKVWQWLEDDLAEEMFKALDVQPIPLTVTGAVGSLQTGLINAVYAHLEGALLLNWFENTNFMNELPITYGTGALVITKKKFDELDPDLQEILTSTSKRKLRELIERSRKDENKWRQILKSEGIEFVPEPAGSDLDVFRNAGKTVQKNLIGKMYSQEILDRVLGYLSEFRNKK